MSHLELRTHRRCAPIFFSQKRANLKSQIVHCALWLSEIKHSSCTPPPQSINNIALWFLLAGFISSFPVFDEILSTFSVVKATLQSQMSVHSFICPSVCLSGSKTPQPYHNLHLHPSSFNFATFKLFSLFL